jgi:hypothetical protein
MKTGSIEALKSVPRSKNISTLLALVATGSVGAVTNQSAARLDFNSLQDYHEGTLKFHVRTDGGVGATPTAVGTPVNFTLKYAFSDDLYQLTDAPSILQSAVSSLVCALPNAISVKASQTFTFTGQPVNNETFTITTLAGTIVQYKLVSVLSGATREILIGANFNATAGNVGAAIGASHPDVTAADNGAGVITITAREFGAAYNAIALTEAVTNATLGGANLAGGTVNATRIYVSASVQHGGRYLYTWYDRDAFAANALINVTAKLLRL